MPEKFVVQSNIRPLDHISLGYSSSCRFIQYS